MKKTISIIILITIVLTCIVQANTYAASIDLSRCVSEDLETTLKIEGITNCDLAKYNEPNNKRVNVYIFRGNGCLNCSNLYKYYVAKRLLNNYGDKINIVSFEVKENSNNFLLMAAIKNEMGEQSKFYYTPYVVIGNKTFSGDLVVNNAEENQSKMEQAIIEQYNSTNRYDVLQEVCGATISRPIKFPFTDVKSTDWYYEDIKYVYENKMILGKTDTLFKPNDTLTRGMLVTIIWRMEGNKKVEPYGFKDVASDQYYYSAVNWAATEKIVSGYSKEEFKPNKAITREQLAVILNNYAEYKGKNVSKTIDISNYKDAKGVADYAVQAVRWSIANKIINGKDNGTRIDPRGIATRAQVAVMLKNYCTKF